MSILWITAPHPRFVYSFTPKRWAWERTGAVDVRGRVYLPAGVLGDEAAIAREVRAARERVLTRMVSRKRHVYVPATWMRRQAPPPEWPEQVLLALDHLSALTGEDDPPLSASQRQHGALSWREFVREWACWFSRQAEDWRNERDFAASRPARAVKVG